MTPDPVFEFGLKFRLPPRWTLPAPRPNGHSIGPANDPQQPAHHEVVPIELGGSDLCVVLFAIRQQHDHAAFRRALAQLARRMQEGRTDRRAVFVAVRDHAFHVDELREVGAPSGWGANFSWSRYFNNQIMPFVRAGYTDDSGSLLSRSVSVGFGYQLDPSTKVPGDLFGAAINWGEVNDASFGPGFDDQVTVELFYRWQLTPRFALTGDYQYLKDPALNPFEDSIHVWAMRGRFAL